MKEITKENKARTDGKKRCTQCLDVKPLSEYYRNKGSWDGHASYCNTCRNKNYIDKEILAAYQKQWYDKNRHELSIKRKEIYQLTGKQHYQRKKQLQNEKTINNVVDNTNVVIYSF